LLHIGVIGDEKANKYEYKIGEQVGAEIGKRGFLLVCGGLGGIMEAASKGAKSTGGLCVGILPGEEKKDANEYIDFKIVTAMSHARNAIITRTADALIAVGGGSGTLSEIALALKIDKPVILVRGALPKLLVESDGIHIVDTSEEALKLAEKLIGERE
jgi:uncharacterized protein (TIGR00725 family)